MSKIELVRLVLIENNTCNKRILCSVLSVARSLIYYQSRLNTKDLLLKKQIESVHEDNVWYGHRRIAWSMSIGFKKARRLMKRFTIVAKVRLAKRFIKTKDMNNPDAGIPNLSKGRCSMLPNVVWRTDFTHIIYHGVHLYLATVIDEYTKEILGYSLSFVHTKEFVLEAIQKAIQNAKASPCILHSDQGSEYTSYLVLNFLKEHGILPSMSKKGSPWENGGQESYYGKLKLELGHPHRYETIEDLIVAIHHQIYYYNYKRIHTTLKMPPKTFRSLFEERKKQEKCRQLDRGLEFVFAQGAGELIPSSRTTQTHTDLEISVS